MNEKNFESLDGLNNIVRIWSNNIKLIVTSTIIVTLLAFIAVFIVIKPKYESTTEIIVNQRLGKDVQAAEMQQIQSTDLQLVNTYKSILTSQSIGSAVKKSVGSQEYKKSELSIDTDATSQVISINVIATSPTIASTIANKTAEIFKKRVTKIMNVNNVSIISKAEPNKKPISPRKTLIISFSIILGIIIGLFASIVKEYNKTTIDSEEYITNELGLTDLGTISDIDLKKIKKDVKN